MINVVQVLLVEDLPVDLKRPDASVFDFKGLVDWVRVSNDSWHWKSRRNSVVVETDLIQGNCDWASRNINAHWELDRRKAFDVALNNVIKLAAEVVIDGHSDWNLSIRRQGTLVWSENQRDSLIVAQKECLLFFKSFCLSKRVSGHTAELLGLLVGIG